MYDSNYHYQPGQLYWPNKPNKPNKAPTNPPTQNNSQQDYVRGVWERLQASKQLRNHGGNMHTKSSGPNGGMNTKNSAPGGMFVKSGGNGFGGAHPASSHNPSPSSGGPQNSQVPPSMQMPEAPPQQTQHPPHFGPPIDLNNLPPGVGPQPSPPPTSIAPGSGPAGGNGGIGYSDGRPLYGQNPNLWSLADLNHGDVYYSNRKEGDGKSWWEIILNIMGIPV